MITTPEAKLIETKRALSVDPDAGIMVQAPSHIWEWLGTPSERHVGYFGELVSVYRGGNVRRDRCTGKRRRSKRNRRR